MSTSWDELHSIFQCDPQLRRAAQSLLPHWIKGWKEDELSQFWQDAPAVQQRYRKALRQLTVLVPGAAGRLEMREEARTGLVLMMLVEERREAEVEDLARTWLLQCFAEQRPLDAAWVFDVLADLYLFRGEAEAMIAALRCSILLRRHCGDQEREALRLYQLGAYLIQQSRAEEGVLYVERAIRICKTSDPPRAERYRRRLEELLAKSDP